MSVDGPAAASPAPAVEIDRRDGRRRWMAGASVAQVYMALFVVGIVTSGRPALVVTMGVVAAALFSLTYVVLVGFAVVSAGTQAQRVAVLVLLFALSIPQWWLIGADLGGMWIFVGVAAGALLSGWIAMVLAVVLAGGMLVLDAAAGVSLQWELAITLVAVTLWMIGFMSNVRLTIELRRTRDDLARTAVAVERERIGRDLHDILGHSLTAIAVKAGLARRLVDRDPSAAAVEISDVERLAREALSDVRATAAGFRDVSLAGELAVARSVLEAAGIVAALPTAVDDVSPAGREVFGYVVREAVTNVIRHSGASRCEILLGPDRVEVRDNGRGSTRRGSGAGAAASGLDGLASRLHAAGGSLQAGAAPGGRVPGGRGPGAGGTTCRFRHVAGHGRPDSAGGRDGPRTPTGDPAAAGRRPGADPRRLPRHCWRRRTTSRWWRRSAPVRRSFPAALRTGPDVALLDVQMPGIDGLTAAAALRESPPDLPG
jgi:two-component system sensor histidine kinase DesK